MTQVYNYFALPPAIDNFCAVAFSVSQEAMAVDSADLDSFAERALPRVEAVFEDFFRAFEQYRVDLAAWNSKYGPNANNAMVQTYTPPSTTAGYGTTYTPQQPTVVAGTNVAPQPVTVATQPGTGYVAPPADDGAVVFVPGTDPNAADPTIALPTQGPIFQSGEVVQGDDTVTSSDGPQ